MKTKLNSILLALCLLDFTASAQEVITITVQPEKQRGLQIIVEKANADNQAAFEAAKAAKSESEQKLVPIQQLVTAQDYLQSRVNDLLANYDRQVLDAAANDPKNQQLFQKALQASPDVQEKIKSLLENGD